MKIAAKQPGNVAQDTKKYIIGTARRFFSEYGYLGVSMNDIAKKLNITKAALYYHFSGKIEIYEKVLNDVFDDLKSSIAGSIRETAIDKKLHELIKNYLDFGLKEKNLIKAMMLNLPSADSQITKHIAELREQITGLIQPVIKEVFANKKTARKIDSRILTSLLCGMMDGLLLECSFLNKKINSAKASYQIIAVLF